jgi:hypothetical protein
MRRQGSHTNQKNIIPATLRGFLLDMKITYVQLTLGVFRFYLSVKVLYLWMSIIVQYTQNTWSGYVALEIHHSTRKTKE